VLVHLQLIQLLLTQLLLILLLLIQLLLLILLLLILLLLTQLKCNFTFYTKKSRPFTVRLFLCPYILKPGHVII
ncbi:MAG: hypothetical protein EOP47_11835, partial [Sphingobacteriaceae bacterium]